MKTFMDLTSTQQVEVKHFITTRDPDWYAVVYDNGDIRLENANMLGKTQKQKRVYVQQCGVVVNQ